MVNRLALIGLVGLAAAVPNHVVYYGPPPPYAYGSVESSTSAEGVETISKTAAEATVYSSTTEAAYTGIPSSFIPAVTFSVEYPYEATTVTTSAHESAITAVYTAPAYETATPPSLYDIFTSALHYEPSKTGPHYETSKSSTEHHETTAAVGSSSKETPTASIASYEWIPKIPIYETA